MSSFFKLDNLFVLMVLSSIFSGRQAASDDGKPRALVFGGNGFIGSEVLSEMIEKGGYDITIVNRGNWYFDSKKRVQPYVQRHLICDRDKAFQFECTELLTSGYYDIVIDFSSYTSRQIQQVVNVLKNRVGLYIYISSDSIYEVCQKDHVAPSKEEDDVRPKSAKKRMTLRKAETYGHEKLACEEVLKKQRKAGGFPYVALRLPDVIGPRDSSFRFWTYQIWINTHKTIGESVDLPQGVSDTTFSLVHVEDVAKGVMQVIELGSKDYNQAINLAFEEHFTLRSLLTDIGKQLKVEEINFQKDEEKAWYTYPTVTKGPLDISRAKILLDWEPMPWQRALASLTKFFDDAMTDKAFAGEREMVIADVIENLIPEEKYLSFLESLKKVYGDEVFEGLDLDIGFAKDAMEIEDANPSVKSTDISAKNSTGEEYIEVADEEIAKEDSDSANDQDLPTKSERKLNDQTSKEEL